MSGLALLMKVDAEGLIGAGRYERPDERATHRNGGRVLDTRWGSPKVAALLFTLEGAQ